jgi:hypothetical protein
MLLPRVRLQHLFHNSTQSPLNNSTQSPLNHNQFNNQFNNHQLSNHQLNNHQPNNPPNNQCNKSHNPSLILSLTSFLRRLLQMGMLLTLECSRHQVNNRVTDLPKRKCICSIGIHIRALHLLGPRRVKLQVDTLA